MIQKVVTNILLGLSIIALIFAVYFTFGSQNKEQIFVLGYKPFIIASGSMEPDYPVNSFVMIKKVSPSEVEVGDAIAYYSQLADVYVFHRVVEITDDGFVMKGDNNEYVDLEIVPFDTTLGRSVFHSNFTVYLLSLFSTPSRFIGFVVVPITSLIIALFTFRYAYRRKASSNS